MSVVLLSVGGFDKYGSIKEEHLEIFPATIPQQLSLQVEELPTGYTFIQDEETLSALNLARNPGYMILPAEQAALAPRGGLCSIVAMYEQNNEIRLMLNAVYFRNAEHCEEFIEIESRKGLHMAAFRKKLPHSEWLIFIASDPKQRYNQDERKAFGEMIQIYQDRLELELLFDELSTSAS
ncbi:hypothetical protein P0Y35_17330 [Kiritimatiellaeota bacterium B1221]|nr:hypothetical protein [Kiritimatiellaeota bacterium B1221]